MDLLKTYVDWTSYALPNDHVWEKINGNELVCLVCNYNLNSVHNKSDIDECKASFIDDPFGKPDEYKLKHFFVPTKKVPNICFACNKVKLSKSTSSSDLTIESSNESIPFASVRRVASFLTFKAPEKTKYLKCLWCQRIIHDSISCKKTVSGLHDFCDLGILSRHIIPPFWILKNDISKFRLIHEQNNINRKHLIFSIKPPDNLSSNIEPMIVFINLKSGNSYGRYLYKSFLKYLNIRQIFTLPDNDPLDVLKLYQDVPKILILICGGDGTLSWISSIIDTLDMQNKCTVTCIPLGTGNDLSQCLKWGHKSNYTSPDSFNFLYHLKKISTAKKVLIDQWSIDFSPILTNENALNSPTSKHSHPSGSLKNLKFINYCSVGADAAIALDFHKNRQNNKNRTYSRTENFLSYFSYTVKYITTQVYKKIFKDIKLFCDYEDMSEKLRKHDVQIILLLNIKSYASGMNPWHHCDQNGNSSQESNIFTAQSTDDGLIEVLGLSLTSFAKAFLNLGGYKIAQCKHVRIVSEQTIHIQVDGEPFVMPPSNLVIERCNQISMLMRNLLKPETSEYSNKSDKEIKVSNISSTNVNERLNLINNRSISGTDLKFMDAKISNSISLHPKRINNVSHQRSSSYNITQAYPIIDYSEDKTLETESTENIFKGEILLFQSIKNGNDQETLKIINSYPNLNINIRESEIIDSDDSDLQNTFLHYAAEKQNVFCISLLLLNGANPYIKNAENKTPYSIIKSQRFSKEILNYINTIHP